MRGRLTSFLEIYPTEEGTGVGLPEAGVWAALVLQ
jgi:hypothetical protein